MEQKTAFQVRTFRVLGGLEIHFGRESQGFFYEIADLGSHALLDAKDGLTEGEFLEAVGCALEPEELWNFQQLVHSLN